MSQKHRLLFIKNRMLKLFKRAEDFKQRLNDFEKSLSSLGGSQDQVDQGAINLLRQWDRILKDVREAENVISAIKQSIQERIFSKPLMIDYVLEFLGYQTQRMKNYRDHEVMRRNRINTLARIEKEFYRINRKIDILTEKVDGDSQSQFIRNAQDRATATDRLLQFHGPLIGQSYLIKPDTENHLTKITYRRILDPRIRNPIQRRVDPNISSPKS